MVHVLFSNFRDRGQDNKLATINLIFNRLYRATFRFIIIIIAIYLLLVLLLLSITSFFGQTQIKKTN